MSDGPKSFSRRAVGAGIAGGVLWGGLVGRLIQLQLVDGQKYADLATENRIRLDPSPARRGVIYDRFGQPIASNKRNFHVKIIPEQTEDFDSTVDALGDLLQLSDRRKKRLRDDRRRGAAFTEIQAAVDISWEEFSRVNVHAPRLSGVYAEVGELRSYPMGAAFAHTIGYVARPNRDELDAMIAEEIARANLPESDAAGRKAVRDRIQRIYRHPDMRLGKQGLEAFEEDYLRGEPGFQRNAVNADGRIVEALDSSDVAPRGGGDVVISVDAELQKYVINRFGDETGSAVVMDIETGDILSMASMPAFDPNDFVSGISQTKYDLLLNNQDAPLYHKAYDGIYPPGSTFKMVVAAAALETGAMKPDDRVYCRGHTYFGGRNFHCWKRGGHGSMDLRQALKHSCDVYFYEAARRTGVDKIAEAARRMGLGQVYELGLTGGARGIVPDSAWKEAARGEPWYEGETLNFGIGQGYLTTSPLQLAVMTARIASNSGARAPRFIIGGPETPDPRAPLLEAFSDDILQKLRDGMYAVTSEAGGTALRSGDLGNGLRLAGKTGTAQVRRITAAERASGVRSNAELERRLRDHALFVSYAPADAPRYVCVVVVDHGGGGSSVAAPIARDIMKETIRLDPMSRQPHQVSRPLANVADRRSEI